MGAVSRRSAADTACDYKTNGHTVRSTTGANDGCVPVQRDEMLQSQHVCVLVRTVAGCMTYTFRTVYFAIVFMKNGPVLRRKLLLYCQHVARGFFVLSANDKILIHKIPQVFDYNNMID
jgi:hypothetical protein